MHDHLHRCQSLQDVFHKAQVCTEDKIIHTQRHGAKISNYKGSG